METVSLETFVRASRFGAVELGMSREQLQDLIGPPEALGCSSRKHRRPRCWRYGDVELHFATGQGTLWLIYLENFSIPRGAGGLSIEPWIIRGGMPRPTLEGRLEAEDIPFEPMVSAAENTSALRVGAGVELLFVEKALPYAPRPGLFALSLCKAETLS
jgi:hypothetical protein